MKKSITYTVLLLTISFFLFNYSVLSNTVYSSIGNYLYKSQKYGEAISYHDKQTNSLKFYNLWNDYYKLWDYEKSIKSYEKWVTGMPPELLDSFSNIFPGLEQFWLTQEESTKIFKDALSEVQKESDISIIEQEETPELFHNLWNAFFKLWESMIKKDDIIKYRKESLLFYERSLELEERQKTRENYEFVKSKLQELEDEDKSEEEKDDTQKQNGSGKQNSEEKKEWDEKDEKEKNSNEKQQEQWENSDSTQNARAEKYKLSWNEKLESITNEEEKAIQDYIENLKQQQQQNQQFFNKRSDDTNKDIIDSILEDWFNFDNNFDNWWEIDW